VGKDSWHREELLESEEVHGQIKEGIGWESEQVQRDRGNIKKWNCAANQLQQRGTCSLNYQIVLIS